MKEKKNNLLKAIEQIKVHDHICLLYKNKAEQFALIIAYIKTGLEKGEKCVYIADQNSAPSLINKMKKAGIDTKKSINSGSLSIITKKEAYLKDGHFDPDLMIKFIKESTKAALKSNYKALRIAYEITQALDNNKEIERLVEYETKLNYVFPKIKISAICQYNQKRFSPDILLNIIRAHPFAAAGKKLSNNPYYILPNEFLKQKPERKLNRALNYILEREETTTASDNSNKEANQTVKKLPANENNLKKSQLELEKKVNECTKALNNSKQKLASIVESSEYAIISKNLDGTITSWNKGAQKIYGYSSKDAIGKNISFLIPHGHANDVSYILNEIKKSLIVSHYETKRKCKNGKIIDVSLTVSPLKNNDGRIIGASTIARDITKRKIAEEKINYLAFHDSLTNLPNRRLFNKRFNQSINNAKTKKQNIALLFLDLNNFKNIKNTIGHDNGDKLLKKLSKELIKILKNNVHIGATGEEEFLIYLENIQSNEEVKRFSEEIFKHLKRQWTIDNFKVIIEANIGIAIYPKNGRTPKTLLIKADTALLSAKETGSYKYEFFKKSMLPLRKKASERLRLASVISKALEHEEFIVYFQPIIDIKTRQIASLEALVRWQKNNKIISPKDFIPLAESTGEIISIGEWILESTLKHCKNWQNKGYRPLMIIINLSAKQFQQEDLAEKIHKSIIKFNIDPQMIMFEITESAVMTRPRLSIKTMHKLKKMGIKISIDDFGTGYSSLNYLKKLPADYIKISQDFIRDIDKSPPDQSIVKAVTAMAHGLGFKVTAEGVENENQLKFIEKIGCDYAQGFLFHKPMPINKIEMLLRKQRWVA